MDALLFVGHGSRDPEGNEEVRAFVRSVENGLDVPIVETCFFGVRVPFHAGSFAACVAGGDPGWRCADYAVCGGTCEAPYSGGYG